MSNGQKQDRIRRGVTFRSDSAPSVPSNLHVYDYVNVCILLCICRRGLCAGCPTVDPNSRYCLEIRFLAVSHGFVRFGRRMVVEVCLPLVPTRQAMGGDSGLASWWISHRGGSPIIVPSTYDMICRTEPRSFSPRPLPRRTPQRKTAHSQNTIPCITVFPKSPARFYLSHASLPQKRTQTITAPTRQHGSHAGPPHIGDPEPRSTASHVAT